MIVSMIWSTSETVSITPYPCHSNCNCWLAEVWRRQCMKYFISFILSYKARKKTALLRFTTNEVGTGHKLHFQAKIPARAKLAAINNKIGCGTAEVWWGQFQKYFISLIISCKARKKTDMLRCTTNQVGTGNKLHFQPWHSHCSCWLLPIWP